MLWRPGPDSTRSTLTCPTSAARNRQRRALQVVLGRPVGVTGLRGDRAVVPAVPHEPGLAEARARGDHGRVPRWRRSTGLEHGEVAVRQRRESPGVRLEVVDQDHAVQTPAPRRAGGRPRPRAGSSPRRDPPAPVRRSRCTRARASPVPRARNVATISSRLACSLAGIGPGDARHQAAPGDLEPREAGVRAADVAREDQRPTAGGTPVTMRAHRRPHRDAVTRPCTSAGRPAG